MKIFIGVMLLAATAHAQNLTLPEASPEASVEQKVGITQLKVTYSRPAVAGRKVWGELVPYGEVWRAGANANTVFTTSTPVKIGGKTLAAGTYGVHMIPTAKEWTVIFSNFTKAWGSYGYDTKDDALRVAVTPQADAMEERLSFRFDDPSDAGATLVMRWEKLRANVKIDVDTPSLVMANIRNELRGVNQFVNASWESAAAYWLQHGGNLDEATKFADRAVAGRENYKNLSTRAAIAEKKGDTKTASAMRAKAEAVATEQDLNQHGYALMQQKKLDEAIATFAKNAQAHPESWNAHDSLAEAYMVKGDKTNAAASYKKALATVKDDSNKKRIEQTLARLK